MPPDMHARPLDYFIVQDPKPAGPSIGYYGAQEISESIVDMFGHRYLYVGAAPRGWDGEFDVNALRPGEFIVLPGLVYRRVREGKSWISSFWH